MIIICSIYILNCFLIIRLFFQWSDKSLINLKINFKMLIIELVLLIPIYYSFKILLLIMIVSIFYHILILFSERNIKNIFFARFIQFVFLLVFFGLLSGYFQDVRFIPLIGTILKSILDKNLILRNINDIQIKNLILYIFGILITINELNNIVRAILKKINTTPIVKHDEDDCKDNNSDSENDCDDDKELNRGKIIGSIERLLFFFFVLTNNYTSIGFILTAKGITRFKKLDDKDFSEYVLIGTLLSSSLSIFWAEIFLKILNAT